RHHERMQLLNLADAQTLRQKSWSKLQVMFRQAFLLTKATNSVAFFPVPSFPRDEQKLQRLISPQLQKPEIIQMNSDSNHLHVSQFVLLAIQYPCNVAILQ